jgi:hypothetical protein
MTDSVQVFDPGFRVLDSNGAPVSGAKIKFYEVGPGSAKDVFGDASLSTNLGAVIYTRSDGYPVVSSGSSTTTLIYVGIDPYYVVITDANDVAIFPAKDNVRGALDTSAFLTTGSTSTLSIANVSMVGDNTLTASHRSKAVNANPGAGQITLTLTAAATLGDGWSVYVHHAGTSAGGRVTIAAASVISTPMGTTLAVSLRPGEGALITCDGAGFALDVTAPAYLLGTVGVINITDRVAAAPISPIAGDRYIATGVFAATPVTTAVGDIIEATGAGTWLKVTPHTDCGWLAFVQDENAYYSFQDSAWVAQFPAASDTVAGIMLVATQADMEAPASLVKAVTPARQGYHPAHPKAWVLFNGTGTAAILISSGVSSLTDNGTGNYTINFISAFSTADYAMVGAGQRTGTDSLMVVAFKQGTTPGVSACNIATVNGAGGLEDAPKACAAFFGDA